MEQLFKIATSLSTPLSLGGLFAAILFFTLKYLIDNSIFPTITKSASAEIIKHSIDRLFTLALIAMIFGFIGFILPYLIIPKTSDKNTLHNPVNVNNTSNNNSVSPPHTVTTQPTPSSQTQLLGSSNNNIQIQGDDNSINTQTN